jgi:hypothetical protein
LGLRIENVGKFYDLLEYFTAIWPFGIVCGHLVYFSQFGMFGPRKIWQPCVRLAVPSHGAVDSERIRNKKNTLGKKVFK